MTTNTKKETPLILICTNCMREHKIHSKFSKGWLFGIGKCLMCGEDVGAARGIFVYEADSSLLSQAMELFANDKIKTPLKKEWIM